VDGDPGGAELPEDWSCPAAPAPIEGVSLVRSEDNAEAVRTTLADVHGHSHCPLIQQTLKSNLKATKSRWAGGWVRRLASPGW
jgi:hypothetical protein